MIFNSGLKLRLGSWVTRMQRDDIPFITDGTKNDFAFSKSFNDITIQDVWEI